MHAADLHLGAPLRGLRAASPEFAERLAKAIPQAYARLVDESISRNVDFVVMAGDIFDQAQPSYANFLQFVRGLQRLDQAGIPVYLLTGNHDPYTSWQRSYSQLPANAYMFPADKPGFTVFHRDGRPLALLGGRGYYNQVVSDQLNIAEGITREAAEAACGTRAPFAVGVLHTGLHLDKAKAPCDLSELLASGFDYWALGHIHKRYIFSSENPRAAFSGCIQGRDILESGSRGCFQVTLTEGQRNVVEFVPLASIVWQVANVDVSSCATLAECHDAIMRELFRLNGTAQCEEMAERVTLVGTTPLHNLLRQPGVLEDLRRQINEGYPIFYCDALIDHTELPIDRESLIDEGLFPAALLRQAQALAADEAAAVAYLQDEFFAHGLVLPQKCSRNVGELQRQAEGVLVDLLRGDSHG